MSLINITMMDSLLDLHTLIILIAVNFLDGKLHFNIYHFIQILGQIASIDVTNSENGYTIQGGLRFTPEKGLFGEKSLFKPYATLNVGGIYLQEKTEYSDPDDIWGNWPGWDSPEYNFFNLDDIEDWRINFIYSVEFGFNFSFPNSNGYGLDVGLRYNMIPEIKKTEQYINEDDTIEADVLNFGNKIDADYMTFYMGVSIPTGTLNKRKSSKLASLF